MTERRDRWRRRGGRGRAPVAAGFTLIELLVAMAIFGLVTVLLGQGLRLGVAALDRVRGAVAAEAAVRGVHGVVRRLLERARPLPAPLAGTVAFRGEPDTVSFVALADGPFGDGVMALLTLARDRETGALVLDRCAAGGEGAAVRCSGPVDRQVLRQTTPGLALAYYGAPAPGDETGWRETWREAKALPRLVRITLADGGTDPTRGTGAIPDGASATLTIALRLAPRPGPEP